MLSLDLLICVYVSGYLGSVLMEDLEGIRIGCWVGMVLVRIFRLKELGFLLRPQPPANPPTLGALSRLVGSSCSLNIINKTHHLPK